MSTTATKPPTLLIVMGTSGSGKSTVGQALSIALNSPFIDGDDLHPASNVDKMSHGHALNDNDREPWLLKIRRTGFELASTQSPYLTPNVTNEHGEGEGIAEEGRKLAEVYETSQQKVTSLDAQAHAAQNNNSSLGSSSSSSSSSSSAAAAAVGGHMESSKRQLAIIACSSLKLIYRRLLRGTITSLSDSNATKPESQSTPPKDFKVVHIYLDLTKELLEERMSNRKGHFMKLDMLYSQLDTLQKPDEVTEPGVVVVKVEREKSTDDIVRDVIVQLRLKGII
ncbi:related to thermoresistant gluconokinase [Melanopsichium pennsylvanicum]|uniref:gluconokinase n=1 Tax=Melanopsichium pennsylvanicum TaxID=63383 RepID=A0AAJ4XP32_9BASI|nr:related to thermoresistant gluconokinase [Melanopsichium pennsylvanicum]